jgi:ArsR family transcriptional regulator, arsenate/arsenite/antimonite-responsive transcriptional repressor
MIPMAVPDVSHASESGNARAHAAAIGTGILFELLADTTRRRILALLLEHREICVCRLVGALDLPQPKVSRHLAAMREAGLLVSRRKGTWILYRFDPQVPGWVMRVIAMMVEGARAEPEFAMDKNRLAQLALCGEDGYT